MLSKHSKFDLFGEYSALSKTRRRTDMAAVDHPEKDPLYSTFMYVDRIQDRSLLKFDILYWGIEYKLLKDGIHEQYVSALKWYLFVTKTSESISVMVQTKACKTIQGYVVYQLEKNQRKYSEPITTEEVGNKKFHLEFPSELVHDKRNEILNDKGHLVLGFMFDSQSLLTTQVELYLEEKDETTNFMDAFERRLFTDFVIRASGKEFHVHKAILAAQSNNFYPDMHRGNGEITLEATSTAVQNMIHYLYSGELPMLTLNEIIDVYELGVKLLITRLVEHCTFYLNDIMTPDNAERIRDVAVKYGALTLVEAADQMRSRASSLTWF